MDDSAPAPRVTGQALEKFIGKKVLVVGEISPVDATKATIKTADERVITVNLAGDGSFKTKFVEFEATVDSADAVTESSRVEFGDDFDQYSYGELCKLIHADTTKEMFY